VEVVERSVLVPLGAARLVGYGSRRDRPSIGQPCMLARLDATADGRKIEAAIDAASGCGRLPTTTFPPKLEILEDFQMLVKGRRCT